MTWMVKRLAAVVLLLMILYYIVFGNVAIIKATAVVGYIAVQDPTKMGDIVSETEFRIPAAFPGTRIVPGMKNSRILTCGFSSECSKWQRQGRDIRRGATVWRR